jgi:hypothetical protein
LHLASALKTNTCLRTCYVEFGNRGAIVEEAVHEAFVETLEFNVTLERVDFGGCRIIHSKIPSKWTCILNYYLQLNKNGVLRCFAHASERACSRRFQVETMPHLSGNLTCLYRYLRTNPGVCQR